MQVSPEHAGLIAQVYPTIVIALMLEARFSPSSSSWGRRFDVFHHTVRVLAILGAITTTFVCLGIARSGRTEAFADWSVLISHYLLLAAFAAMAGSLLAAERRSLAGDVGGASQKLSATEPSKDVEA